MQSVEIVPPKLVLVVVAHPDDADFGCGGTIAKWVNEGVEVHYCLATSGGAGGFDPSIDRSLMPEIRRNEQRNAGAIYGVSSIEFLEFEDGSVEPNQRLRHDISRVIRKIRPDTVVCQSPERNYQRIHASHPDHIATGEAALRSVYPDSRNRFAFPDLFDEGLEPHIVPQVLLMASPQSNLVSDITMTIDTKIRALLEHKSQLPNPHDLPIFIRNWARTAAEEAGYASPTLIELFQVVQTA